MSNTESVSNPGKTPKTEVVFTIVKYTKQKGDLPPYVEWQAYANKTLIQEKVYDIYGNVYREAYPTEQLAERAILVYKNLYLEPVILAEERRVVGSAKEEENATLQKVFPVTQSEVSSQSDPTEISVVLTPLEVPRGKESWLHPNSSLAKPFIILGVSIIVSLFLIFSNIH